MSLALHGHQVLIIATLAFVVAVLIPFWYTSPSLQVQRNVFQICTTMSNSCYWTLLLASNNQTIQTILPVFAASLAIACVGISLIGLLLGSWYIQRSKGECRPKCLLVFTIISVFISFLFSCGVWSIMLTSNLYQNDSIVKAVRLEDFGFSFWINIGASGAYLYGFVIYLLALCM